MSDLFDMIAGTSTGGIISLALSMENNTAADDPMFWAEDILDLYFTSAGSIFMPNEGMSVFW